MFLFECLFLSMLVGVISALEYDVFLTTYLFFAFLGILAITIWMIYQKKNAKENSLNRKSARVLFILVVSLLAVLISWKFAGHYKVNKMTQLSKISNDPHIVLYLTKPMMEKSRNDFQGSSKYYCGTFNTIGLAQKCKVTLNLPEAMDLGQQIVVETSTLQIPKPSGGTGQIDFRGYNFSKGILLEGNLDQHEYTITDQYVSTLPLRVETHKQRFYLKLDSYFGEEAGLVKGMVFGDTEDILEEDLTLLTSLGIRHLFAVSGFHVGIYYCLLLILCAAVGCRGWPRAMLIITGLMYFCLLTGNSASTLRASLVLSLYLIMENLQWEKCFASSLALAGMVLLAWNPYLIYNVGYKLSFAATFGILYLYPFFKQLFGIRILGVGLSAWLGSLPFQTIFHGVSWLGIIITPIFSVFLGLFLPCIFCAYLLDFCFLSNIILIGLQPVLKLLERVLHIFDSSSVLSCFLTDTLLHFPITSFARMLFYDSCLAILVWVAKKTPEKKERKEQFFAGFAIFLLVVFLGLPVPARGLEVVFMNVGQGDASLVRYQDFNMLVDTGTKQAGQYAVVPFLESKKIEHLDLLVLTHLDQDHIGGALKVLDCVNVDYVAFSYASKKELQEDEVELLKRLEEKKVSYGFHVSGDEWRVKDLTIQALSPVKNSCHEQLGSNEGSLVLGLSLEKMYLQITGDVDGSMLENIIRPIEEEKIFLFKVPHHGSKGSFDKAIFDQLNIDLVVVSCGQGNRYGHPHQEVTDYWLRRAVPIYRTDEQGELFFRYSQDALFLEN